MPAEIHSSKIYSKPGLPLIAIPFRIHLLKEATPNPASGIIAV